MTEATTGANKAKTAKHTASSFGVHNYEMPKFDLPKMEMPGAFREMAEKGVAQAKDNYEKMQAVTVEATELLKDTYTTAAKGATLTAAEYRAKAAEYAELLKAASLPAEVHEFQRLERSYLMLAENEEWMAGNHDKINIRGADENSYGDSVPASDGSGEPGLSMSGWFGFFAPKGTPKDIIAKLNGAVTESLADATVQARLADLGQEIYPPDRQNPEALAALQKAEIEKWWPIVKAANIKAE